MSRDSLVYDWNINHEFERVKPAKVEVDDETLRDGLQSPSVTNPSIEDKIKILHLMNDLGETTADLGLPCAGPHAFEHVLALAKEIDQKKLRIKGSMAGRTLVSDAKPMVEIQQQVGMPMVADLFIGSSPIRQFTEGWELQDMIKTSTEAVKFAVDEGMDVMYVTEDTTRSHPDDIKAMYTAAIECGARRICVCDTVGHVTPDGVKALLTYVRKEIVEPTGEDVKIDWHGHEDRGLGIPNTLSALEAGADRVHGTCLGIGERVGNTPMDILLVNLKLLGWIDWDLSKLGEYCHTVSEAVQVPIPKGYPVIGDDAFMTGTGVHAAAIIKALNKKDDWLADRVYSGVPAAEFGLEQKIGVGPMSGKSNVVFWLEKNGHEVTDERVDRIFAAAKKTRLMLSEDELKALV